MKALLLRIFRGKTSAQKDRKNEVLAVITDDESQQFKEVATKVEAIDKTIITLIEKKAQLEKERIELWDAIHEKYGIDHDISLCLNHKTKELKVGNQ